MAITIGEVTAEVQEEPPPAREAATPQRRAPPDMPRILAELRREADRALRLWCD